MPHAVKYILISKYFVYRGYHEHPVFIATSAASDTINNLTLTDNWQHFARIFGRTNIDATTRKPNAIYMIPIYSGASNFGHWTLAIIHKWNHHCSAWIIDSLGGTNLNSPQANTIARMFSSSRITFNWVACTPTLQTEIECGPRTMKAMYDIIHNYPTNTENITNLINVATNPCSSSLYSPSYIRNSTTSIFQRIYNTSNANQPENTPLYKAQTHETRNFKKPKQNH